LCSLNSIISRVCSSVLSPVPLTVKTDSLSTVASELPGLPWDFFSFSSQTDLCHQLGVSSPRFPSDTCARDFVLVNLTPAPVNESQSSYGLTSIQFPLHLQPSSPLLWIHETKIRFHLYRLRSSFHASEFSGQNPSS